MNGLRFAREIRGLSQMELARKTGIHNTKISQVEKGWRQFSLEELQKVAQVLQVSAQQLQTQKTLEG